jgi:hypothetical protein
LRAMRNNMGGNAYPQISPTFQQVL